MIIGFQSCGYSGFAALVPAGPTTEVLVETLGLEKSLMGAEHKVSDELVCKDRLTLGYLLVGFGVCLQNWWGRKK